MELDPLNEKRTARQSTHNEKIVLAVFKYQLQLDEAFDHLQKIGITIDNIQTFSKIGNTRGGFKVATIGTHPDDRFADFKSELFRNLTKQGVPRDDALLFTNCVRHGEKLIAVTVGEEQIMDVTRILETHGPGDLISRRLYAQEVLQNPGDGISQSPFTHISQSSSYENDRARWTAHHADIPQACERFKVYTRSPSDYQEKLGANLNE